MLGVQELSKRYALSEKTVRRYLDTLAPVIGPYRLQGENNKILLTDAGLAIFDRFMQLRRESRLSPSAALAMLKEELQNGANGMSGRLGNPVQARSGVRDPVVEELRARVEEQGQQIAFLQDQVKLLMQQLAEAQAQIQVMLPASIERSRKRWWQFWKW